MTHKANALTRFAEILDAYGSDIKRWPAEDQRQMEQLLASSHQARELLEETAKLDSLLDQFTVPDINGEVRNLIIGAIPISKSGIIEKLLAWIIPQSPKFLWKPALAMTLPLLVGFVVGFVALGTYPVESMDSWEEDIYLVGVQETGDTRL